MDQTVQSSKMSTKKAESQRPSTEPLTDIGKQMLENLKRDSGRPDLMLKENPHRVRKPMPDPGEKKAPQKAD